MLSGVTIAARVRQLPWNQIEESLERYGHALTSELLTAAECAELIALYPKPEVFRSRIEMARYRFGEGDYQYFDYPLPPAVEELRVHTYPPLARVANRWMEEL